MSEPKDELLKLVKRAICVLKKHELSNGLTDHQAMIEFHGIFNGTECRNILALASDNKRRPQA